MALVTSRATATRARAIAGAAAQLVSTCVWKLWAPKFDFNTGQRVRVDVAPNVA